MPAVKVLALVGSPRKQGNTDIMAEELLAGARELGATTSKVYLDDYRIWPIGEVGDDSRNREDARSDDDFPALLEGFLEADVVVWSTPIYWGGPSGQMKCFVDRMSSYFRRPPYAERFVGKSHVVLCAFARSDPEHGKLLVEPMKLTIEVLRGRFLGSVCSAGTYEKGKVRSLKETLRACRELGRRAVLDRAE